MSNLQGNAGFVIETAIGRLKAKHNKNRQLHEAEESQMSIGEMYPGQSIGIIRTPTNIIFPELVLLRPSSKPAQTISALTHLDNGLNDIHLSPVDRTGAAGIEDLTKLKGFESSITEGELFIVDNVVYKSIVDDPTVGGTVKNIQEAIFSNKVRFYSDAGSGREFEKFRGSEVNMIVSKWIQRAKTRKSIALITNELVQDLEASGIDADGSLEDLLHCAATEGMNKDVIQKLVSVSAKYNSKRTPKSILDLSTATSITEAGRDLHYFANELAAQIEKNTHYNATYIVASSRAVSLLLASGWLKEYEGETPSMCAGTISGGKLKVFKDTQSPFDYVLAGFVHDEYNGSDMEGVGSLIMSPYTNSELGLIDAEVMTDPDSLNPVIQVMARYGLGVNPFNVKDNIEWTKQSNGNDIVKGYLAKSDDWESLAGKSLASVALGVILPESSLT